MTIGHIRDYVPYVTLTLPGSEGPFSVEFLLDTGFDGELALPSSVISRLDADYATDELVRMADGSLSRRAVYEIILDWDGEGRITDVLALDGGIPLLGGRLLAEQGVFLQMTDGGEVTIEAL